MHFAVVTASLLYAVSSYSIELHRARSSAVLCTECVPTLSWSRLRAGGTENNNEDNAELPPPLIKLAVFDGSSCPYAARTWMTVLELGIPHEILEVSPMKKPAWLLERNPRGKVPVLENLSDGSVVYESSICNEYLCDLARENEEKAETKSNSNHRLMPASAKDRAKMRLLCDHFDNDVAPAQYTFFMNTEDEKDDELRGKLEDALDYLENALLLASKESKGASSYYLMGADFTLADIHVLPFLLRLVVSLKHFKGYQLPEARFPLLLEWYARCQERPSFQTTGKTEEDIITIYQRFKDMSYKFGGLNRN